MENITTINGGSPKLGPGTSTSIGKHEIRSVNVRCVPVGNIKYESLVEGNVYLVYRKHEQTGEPTYSLCIYKNGNWVPYGLEQYIGPLFTGIPVMDDDYWVCANTAFAEDNHEPESEPENQNPEDTKKEPTEETVREYVERRLEEIAKNEAEEARKAKEEEMRCEEAGGWVPQCMPITPSSESIAIKSLSCTIEILMEYIQKMKDGMVNEPVIEQNWEHLKNFTNQLLDRILELEKRMDNIPIMLPCRPYQPLSPNTPLTPGYPTSPSVPDYPAYPPYPYGPIITYALPGGTNITSTYKK